MNRLPPMLKCARNSTAELTIFVPSTVIIISGRGRKQPDRMAGKIAREMLAFYGPYCPAYYRWKTRHLSREYSQTLIAIQAADLRRQWAPYKLLENLIHRTTLNSHKTDLAFQYLVFSGVVSCFWHALTRWLLAYPQQRS